MTDQVCFLDSQFEHNENGELQPSKFMVRELVQRLTLMRSQTDNKKGNNSGVILKLDSIKNKVMS